MEKSKHCTIRSHFICIVQHWQSCVYTSMFDFHPLFVVLGQWCIHFSQVCFHFNRQQSSQRRYFFGNNDFVWGILSAVWLTELRINFLSKMNFNKLRLAVIPKEACIPVTGNLGLFVMQQGQITLLKKFLSWLTITIRLSKLKFCTNFSNSLVKRGECVILWWHWFAVCIQSAFCKSPTWSTVSLKLILN